MYLGKSKGVFKLGGTFSGFGNATVGRLPALKIPEHLVKSCDLIATLVATEINHSNQAQLKPNTLVKLTEVQFTDDLLQETFAQPREETERMVEDCDDNNFSLLNSGFSEFHNQPLPQNKGDITGVLLKENNDYFLAIRDLNDVDFTDERCADVRETSNQLFFSEIADPNNNTSARFIELYNASEQAINLKEWSIHRYTNGSTTISSTIDLSGYTILPNSTLVIAKSSQEFELVYGFVPNLEAGANSPADSNGDDNLTLVDPFGTLIDTFGNLGTDGTGTAHEFEDGKAIRKTNVSLANPVFTPAEWIIYNDSGGNGTINNPQNAPNDFNPGKFEN